MRKQEQIEYQQQIETYLQRNNVNQTMLQLLQSIMLSQPQDPVQFMKQILKKPLIKTIFIIAPPELKINQYLNTMLKTKKLNYTSFDTIQFNKQISSDDQQDIQMKKIMNENNILIANKIKQFIKGDRNCIIQGYPNTLKQAIFLQQQGIVPNKIIFINTNSQILEKLCIQKLLSLQLSVEKMEKRVFHLKQQYQLNIKSLKQFYSLYEEIDLMQCEKQGGIIAELQRSLEISTLIRCPRQSSQILVIGSAYSGRTTLGLRMAKKYKLIYICVASLIADEIRSDTITGRKIKNQYLNYKLIDSFTVQKLIEQRTSKKDCQMQGFVLEGYPKNTEQLNNIHSLRLKLSFIIAIDAPKALCQQRNSSDRQIHYQSWVQLCEQLHKSSFKIFWLNPYLNIENMFEQASYQFEKQI